MAGFLKSVSMVLVAAVLLANVIQPGEAAVGCGTVVSYLSSCIPYLTNKGPLGGCCSGVKGLYGVAKTTPDRQSACNCLKSVARSYTGLNYAKAAGLPGQCGVTLPYKISPSTDCTKVQ